MADKEGGRRWHDLPNPGGDAAETLESSPEALPWDLQHPKQGAKNWLPSNSLPLLQQSGSYPQQSTAQHRGADATVRGSLALSLSFAFLLDSSFRGSVAVPWC